MTFPPPLVRPNLGFRVDLGVENGTNLNVVTTFLFDFKTHYRPILNRLDTMNNAAGRQTESDGNRSHML